MKSVNRFMLFFLISSLHQVHAKGTDFEVTAMPLPDAVGVLWNQVLKKPFMLSPDLTLDTRKLTLHIQPDNDEREFIIRYLDNMHIRVSTKKGIDYLYPYQVIPSPPRFYTFTYTPKFRDVAYLASVLGSSFTQNGTTPVSSSSPGTAAAVMPDSAEQPFMSTTGDTFVYRGTKRNIDQIRALLPEIDVRADQIDVTAYVFEVSTDERNGSGLQLAAKLLNSHFSVNIGSRSGYGNFLQFSSGSLDALYEIFRTDNRFSLVTGAHSRVISGANTSLAGGASVPTLGSVSYENGTPVQSVEYRNTGVTLQVKPVITENIITMSINEQLSDYAETTTGVNNSPTFTNRQIITNVNMKDGDIIVLSGLTQSKDNTTKTGLSFLPKSWSQKSNQKQGMDLLIVLQAKKVKG
ncbi:type II secretion system protein GspD [Salmonella enterica subsp. diarizonae]|uniref:Type II secretion system protein GspD n=1 Tax=Salmonella diarizonae TaxID=59204 RepID=A0A6C8Y605_SALDZ|nr:type II secretion system protein GspD [Salmonella enterica subsp. diarizonae]